MTLSKLIAIVVALGLCSVPTASADTPGVTRIKSDATLTTAKGSVVQLPPGYYLPDPVWLKLDTEVKRLQDRETQLAAENKQLRTTASAWEPGWKTLTLALLTGATAGFYIHSKI